MTSRPTVAVNEGYARLPEDLLRDLLGSSSELLDAVDELLGANLDRKAELRSALEDLGLLVQLAPGEVRTISCVDGGFAIERTSSVDLSLAVAVGVEGLSDATTFWEGTQYEWWARVGKHSLEGERLCRGVMVAQELSILCDAPHDFKILDGSHLTPIIQLNAALTVSDSELRGEAIRVWDRLRTISSLGALASDDSILAMPKYDSSREISNRLESRLHEPIPGDDKFLMTLLLEPNEYVVPQQVPDHPWKSLHFNSPSSEHHEIVQELQSVIEPLRSRKIAFTYFKPDALSPAYRVELKSELSESNLRAFLTTIKGQMTGPFVREPYPQYLADVMAKSVGLGLSALQSAVQLALSKANRPDLAELLLTSYRTEGV